MTAFRWGRNAAQNFSWLRIHDPRTGKRRPKPVSLMRIADTLGYKNARPLERALTPAHWGAGAHWADGMMIRPPRKWQRLGGVLGVEGLTGENWSLPPELFRTRCAAIALANAPWWQRLARPFACLFGYGNPRVRPTVIGPMGEGE